MGGCATKPKVLTGDGKAPAPVKDVLSAAPVDAAKVEEASAAADLEIETKEKGAEVVEEGKKVVEGHKANEIVGEREDKPRSLSNLFKVNEGKEGEAEANPAKQEVSGTEKPKDESETKQPEAKPSSKHGPSEPENPNEEAETKAVAVAMNTEASVGVGQTTTPAAVVVEVPAKAESKNVVVDVTPTPAETKISEAEKTEGSK